MNDSEHSLTSGGTETTIKASVQKLASIDIVEVTRDDLSRLSGSSFLKSAFSVLFGFSISALLTMFTTLITVTFPAGKSEMIYTALTGVSFLGTLVFGILWFWAERQSSAISKKYGKK